MEEIKNGNEISLSKELEEYINKVIGYIDCGEDKYRGDNYIIELEDIRRNEAKMVVLSIIKNNTKDSLSIFFSNNLRGASPSGRMDSLDLELLINYATLSVFNVIRKKNLEILNYHKEATYFSNGAKQEMHRHISRRSSYYNNRLSKLIEEREEYINNLTKNSLPSFDFFNEVPVVYGDFLKIKAEKYTK